LLLLVFVFSSVIAAAYAQRKAPTQSSEQTEATHEAEDPLGRSTPRGTLLGFLQAAQSGKYDKAAQFLQLSRLERAANGERLARQLHELLDQAFVGRIGALSDKPEGSPQPGIQLDRDRIGVFRINDTESNVDLVHVADPATGSVWLFSSGTLADVPKLFDQLEETGVEAELPRFLVTERILSTPLWRWIAFLLLIPLALALSWATVSLLRGGLRIWLRWRHNSVLQDLQNSIAAPLRLILTVVFHWAGITFTGFPLLFREYYQRFAGIILAGGVAWLVFRLINRWAERARAKTLADSGYHSGSIILLGQRILNLIVVIVAVLVMLSILGFNLTTAVAGLGIGSIAVAFAAQKTLENLLGGISIIGDQVIRVGEICRVGQKIGVVEDISLRSTRIRTLDSSELSVPNGQLASMNIENLSRYDKNSVRTTIRLQRETSPEQLRSLLAKMQALLRNDPRVDLNVARVRLIGFGESSLDVEIYCHILTGDWNEFLAIREDLLLRIMDLITDAGTGLAFPSRTLYMSRDQGSWSPATHDAEQNTSERRHRS
jgi:MscS family membrane protein